MNRLEGNVAIVTGAGSGIGRETAKLLAAEGAAVVVNGRRRAPLDAVVREIEKGGGRAAARPGDMGNPEEARALADWSASTLGRVDILVHSAGIASRIRNVRWVPQPEWDSVLAVNLTGLYALTQAVLPGMIERRRGTIVAVASMAAFRPGSVLSGAPYGAAKAGVLNLMRHLHAVAGRHGIRATAILPAEVDTPIMDRRPIPPDAAARAMMMKPQDIAAAILLCVTLPQRTVIQEVVLSPTMPRDMTKELEAARRLGEPGYTP